MGNVDTTFGGEKSDYFDNEDFFKDHRDAEIQGSGRHNLVLRRMKGHSCRPEFTAKRGEIMSEPALKCSFNQHVRAEKCLINSQGVQDMPAASDDKQAVRREQVLRDHGNDERKDFQVPIFRQADKDQYGALEQVI